MSRSLQKRPILLRASWRTLLMLNYQIDPSILQPFVPRGTILDSVNGKTLISLVGFLFRDTRFAGLPIPFHINFEEINLRFYVRRELPGDVRRGVVFVREIVPRYAIAAMARLLYNEQYVSHPMSHNVELPEMKRSDGRAEYRWKVDGRENRIWGTFEGEPKKYREHSEEFFITEHFWGYTRQRNGSTVEYEVEHPQWNLWRCADAGFDCDIASFYGAEFAEAISGAPDSAFVADGSPVLVRLGSNIG